MPANRAHRGCSWGRSPNSQRTSELLADLSTSFLFPWSDERRNWFSAEASHCQISTLELTWFLWKSGGNPVLFRLFQSYHCNYRLYSTSYEYRLLPPAWKPIPSPLCKCCLWKLNYQRVAMHTVNRHEKWSKQVKCRWMLCFAQSCNIHNVVIAEGCQSKLISSSCCM